MSFKELKEISIMFRRSIGWFFVAGLLLAGCSQNIMPLQPVEMQETAKVEPVCTKAIHQMMVPEQWNGDVLVYAHGFVAPGLPVALPEEGKLFAQLAMLQGFGFATTSYPENGMAVQEGLRDIVSLVKEFRTAYPSVQRVYLAGISMGGLIAAMAAEKYPHVFSGVLAMGGPYGDFITEVNYIGDFRVVFDYFFKDVLPGSAVEIPKEIMVQWESVYMPSIIAQLSDPQNSSKVRQLISVTKVPVDPSNPQSAIESILGVLFFNVFATSDVQARLGGQPFSNVFRKYSGSDNDVALNAGVERCRADMKAVASIPRVFGTTGYTRIPVVTMHTAGDYIIPIVQQQIYTEKVGRFQRSGSYSAISLDQYGHCTFTPDQIAAGFGQLVGLVMANQKEHQPVVVKQ